MPTVTRLYLCIPVLFIVFLSSSCGSDSGPTQPQPEAVRFIALGNTGEGNATQYAVAAQIKSVCANLGCDFVVLLGNNIFATGVDGTADAQWNTKFEQPYTNLDLPFYAIAGPIDYGGPTPDDQKVLDQIAYSSVSNKWKMPDNYYSFEVENVKFIMLDTTAIKNNNNNLGDQAAWIGNELVNSSDWVIVSGHHSYLSNGSHGNAGSYDGVINIPLVNGTHVKNFFDNQLCGNIHVYLSAFDDNLQWMNEPNSFCGTEMIISGAGSKNSAIASATNQTHFEDGTLAGFFWMEIIGNNATGRFYDSNGNMIYQRSFSK